VGEVALIQDTISQYSPVLIAPFVNLTGGKFFALPHLSGASDFVEHLAQFAEVGEELADFGVGRIRNVTDPRALAVEHQVGFEPAES
jgi:hypothetical protein